MSSSPARQGRVAVVGAGPAGMAAALSLHQAGHQVLLLGRYPQARAAGNILNLWPPPIKALSMLGVDTSDLGAPCESQFRRSDGRVRCTVRLPADVIRDYSGGFIGLLRPELYERMAAALPPGMLRANRAVELLEQDARSARLHLSDGTVEEADGDGHAAAARLAADFAAPLPQLVAATDPDNIQRWVLRDREPLKRWSRGRVTLAGDAAHATSPYAAYGAGMAIEDGYFLGRRLAGLDLTDYAAVQAALDAYETPRRPHTARQTQQAWILGKVFHHAPAPLRPVRDLILDHTPLLQKVVGESSPREIISQLDDITEAEKPFRASLPH